MSSIKPIDTSKIKKILIIQLQPFGDVFISTSITEAIKRHIPHAEIYYLAYKPYYNVLLNHPYIDHIIPVEKGTGFKYYINRVKTLYSINRLRFDLVIDLQNNPNTQIITFLSRAKYRVGWEYGQYAFLYNYKATKGKARYHGSQKFDMLLPLGIPEQPFKYYYHITEGSIQYINNWLSNVGLREQGFLMFSPGSPVVWKKWGLDHYSALGDLIWEEFRLPIVLLWAKSEYEDCCVICDNMTHKPIMAPETDLNQAMALLKQAKLLICNDGGLNHISCAIETKTIAIFGHTNPIHWSPTSVFSHHQHLFNANYQKELDDSFGISPEDVMKKIMEFLKQTH